MDNYVTLSPSSCLILNSQTKRICLPAKEVCLGQPTDGLFSECGEGWNCTHCDADADFQIPFVSGDKIQLLATFYDGYNPDPENPVSGFGSFIVATFDGDVTGITTNLSLFSSRQMVAYGCGRSYQIIEIDTSLFPDCIWSVTLTSYDSNDEQVEEVCSQEFGKVLDKGKTVIVKGNNSGSDCFGGCYEEPDAYVGDLIQYDNSLRFFGYVKDSDIAVERIVVQERSTSTRIEDQFVFQLGKPIPPFLHRVLVKQMLASDSVTIAGETYFTPESFSTSNEIEKGYMLLYAVTLTQECSSNANCQ